MVDSAIRNVFGFVVAVMAATVLASIFSTQFVIVGLQAIGLEIPFGTCVSMTVTALALLRIYLIIGGTAMLIAFLVAGAVARMLRMTNRLASCKNLGRT